MGLININSIPTYTQNFGLNYTNNIFGLYNNNVPIFPSFQIPNIQNLYNLNNFLNTNFSQNHSYQTTGKLGNDIANAARSYIGYKESDGSYKLFTNNREEAWCADFVTYVVKQAYKRNGKTTNFGSPQVSNLKKWGEENNCYINLKGNKNKVSTITKNVKEGDVVIFAPSHTGIVASVNKDTGEFSTIEGNTSNGKVKENFYSANNSRIQGFVQVA